jgi:hypothetical protein
MRGIPRRARRTAMLYMWVNSIHCEEETNEAGDDEPYLIMIAVDLLNQINIEATVPIVGSVTAGLPFPTSQGMLYGPFEGDFSMAQGNTRFPPFRPFWGLNGREMDLRSPDDAIIIAALMENDHGSANASTNIVSSSISATIAATAGQDRATRVQRLLETTMNALQTPTGVNPDQIIEIKELRFERSELDTAETGAEVAKVLRFDGDGGTYTIGFRVRNRGQGAWRFCNRCMSMFWNGNPDSKGICPTGGPHVAQGFTFFLPHDRPPSATDQRFRFCSKCMAMFQAARSLGSAAGDPGTCAAGEKHLAQGFRFVLPNSHGGPGQDSWARCGKCRVLFFDGDANRKGSCAGGGTHAHASDLQGNPTTSLKLDFEDL